MLLIEEVGELAGAIRRTTNKFNDRKKIYIEGELIDVMSYLFQIADRFNVDLDKTWRERVSRIKETKKNYFICNDKCPSV
jgi:NTP pyrophosphatase (non-canonical NTP hydrolase)